MYKTEVSGKPLANPAGHAVDIQLIANRE